MPGTKPSPANACALRNRTTSASPSIRERCAGTYMANDPVPMIVSVHVQDEGSRHFGSARGSGARCRTMRRDHGDSLARLAMHDMSDAAPSRPSGLTGGGPSESSCKSGRRSST